MNIFIFPSPERPQFYFSDDDNVMKYFIHCFLYSGKKPVQLLINMLKLMVPDSLLCLLLRTLLRKEKHFPHDQSEAVNSLESFIRHNSALFFTDTVPFENIYYIIRSSKWQRVKDKYVVIFFKKGEKLPFTVVKAAYRENKESIEKEYGNSQIVYNRLKEGSIASIPEPVAFHSSDKSIAYFERVIEGIPFNDYLKRVFSKKKKQDLYIDALSKCKNFLISLNNRNSNLHSREFDEYFFKPIQHVSTTDLGKKHYVRLRDLGDYAGKMQKTQLRSVWMHGDLWPGSILYSTEKIGVIDWEFFSERGVPLWDFFSLVFHNGAELDYFTDPRLSQCADTCILELSSFFQIDKKDIQFMFQAYILFNIKKRDTDTEKYWQNYLGFYWTIYDSLKKRESTLL